MQKKYIAAHRRFRKKYLGEGTYETIKLGTQCVAAVKKHAEEVFGVKLGSFLGTAYLGYISGNPFKGLPFVNIKNTPDFIPQMGDYVFFAPTWKNTAGHVGIVDEGSTITNLVVLNQNMGNGDGKGKDDVFRISNFDYTNPKCLGVYRYTGK